MGKRRMAKYSLQEEPPPSRSLAHSAFLRGCGEMGNGEWARAALCDMCAGDGQTVRRDMSAFASRGRLCHLNGKKW